MARPDDLPEWASGGSASLEDPGSAKKALGWVFGEAPPAAWFNWWMNLLYLWIVYIDPYIVPTGTIGYPYNVSGSQHTVELAPGVGCGWTQRDTITSANVPFYRGGPPRNVCSYNIALPMGTFDPISLTKGLSELFPDNVLASGYVTITAMTMLYARGNAGATIEATIVRTKRDGTGGASVVATLTGTGTAGTFVELAVSSIGHAIDDTYVYWIEVRLQAVADPDDARIAFLSLTYTKTRVE